jgi:hypothetical protein
MNNPRTTEPQITEYQGHKIVRLLEQVVSLLEGIEANTNTLHGHLSLVHSDLTEIGRNTSTVTSSQA